MLRLVFYVFAVGIALSSLLSHTSHAGDARVQASQEAPQLEVCPNESEIATTPPAHKVLLSFDDGPDPHHTQTVLNLLEKYQVPAVFFMIAQKMQANPDIVRLVQASPYATIANHSWSHPNFPALSATKQSDEIEQSDATLKLFLTPKNKAPGSYKFFRYPYGSASCESKRQLTSLHYKIVGWHVNSCDWAFASNGRVNAAQAAGCGVLTHNQENFLGHVLDKTKERGGGIILMHDVFGNTIAQLEQLILKLKSAGYTFSDITDPDFADSLH